MVFCKHTCSQRFHQFLALFTLTELILLNQVFKIISYSYYWVFRTVALKFSLFQHPRKGYIYSAVKTLPYCIISILYNYLCNQLFL